MFRKFFSGLVAIVAVTLVGSAMAGEVRGARQWRGVVGTTKPVDLTFTFRGQESAVIRVVGDGDGDIDCVVFDEFDNVGAIDADDTDTCLLRFTPKRTGDFTLRIRNNGREASAVKMETN